MYHKEVIEQLVKFISERDGIADKSRLAPQVQQSFCLVKERSVFTGNILCEPAKPCETAHYAAFPDNRPPQLLRIYYQGMSFDTTKHREMRTYGFAPPFELPSKITYRPTG